MIFLVNKFINSKDRGKIFLKYESIRMEKDLILKDLKSQVVDLSVEIASKILKRELNEKQSQDDYIQKLIDEIEIK